MDEKMVRKARFNSFLLALNFMSITSIAFKEGSTLMIILGSLALFVTIRDTLEFHNLLQEPKTEEK